jgi:hypothetical protein
MIAKRAKLSVFCEVNPDVVTTVMPWSGNGKRLKNLS